MLQKTTLISTLRLHLLNSAIKAICFWADMWAEVSLVCTIQIFDRLESKHHATLYFSKEKAQRSWHNVKMYGKETRHIYFNLGSKWTRVCYALLLLMLGLSTASYAQLYNFKRVSIKDGLAENQSKKLLLDHKSFIWVASASSGLSKFNGHEVELHNTKNGLPGNEIQDIKQDAAQNLWIATENGLAKKFGRKTETFFEKEDSPKKYVALDIDTLGNIWYAPYEGNVGYFKDDIPVEYSDLKLSKAKKTDLFFDSHNKLWIGTEDLGLFMYDGRSTRFFNNANGLLSETVYAIHEIDGDIVVATPFGPFTIIGDTAMLYGGCEPIIGSPVYVIHRDKHGRIWFGTEKGAYVMNRGELTRITEENGLDGDVKDIMEDHEGGIWFATNHGVFQLENEFFRTYTKDHGLPDNVISGLAKDANGKIWALSSEGVTWVGEKYMSPLDWFAGGFEQKKPVIDSDKQGNIYIGDESALYAYDAEVDELNTMYFPEVMTFTASAAFDSTMLFASISGLYILQGDTAMLPILSSNNQAKVQGTDITALATDNKKGIWMGTATKGLLYLHNDSVYNVLRPEDIFNKRITDLLIDSLHNVWVATDGASIGKLKQGKLPYVSYEDSEITSSAISSLELDGEGNIWIGTNRGLDKMTPWQNDLVKVVHYSEEEGFFPLETTKGALLYNPSDNRLWVGTVEGASEANLSIQISSKNPPRIFVQNIQVNFEEADWQEYANPKSLNNWFGIPSEFKLPNDMNQVIFSFQGLSYTIPDKIRFKWRLKGLENNWTPPSFRTEAVYSNLPPGNYTFEVKACSFDGIWNETPATIRFEITKPFYRTKIFIVTCVMLAVGIGYTYVKYRMKYLEGKQQQLALKVKERTNELESQKSRVQQQSQKLEAAMLQIDEKNQELTEFTAEMTSSLEYGRRIQNAILSYENVFKKNFPESFQMHIPKKVVYGDFLWVKEARDGKVFIALGDCTGNGVPAAFVSLISNDFLNQAMSENPDIDPAGILFFLNEKVGQTLRQSGKENLNDGLDIAVCCVDKANKTLTYAGARRPIIYIQNGELSMLKASFYSIGLDFAGMQADYSNQEVPLSDDATYYLFSDGFPNQFGGESNKKYKISQFKELLKKVHEMPVEGQKNYLVKEFTDWSEGKSQIDDVMVVGFRL